jgi:hypothetical protein
MYYITPTRQGTPPLNERNSSRFQHNKSKQKNMQPKKLDKTTNLCYSHLIFSDVAKKYKHSLGLAVISTKLLSKGLGTLPRPFLISFTPFTITETAEGPV